MKVERLKYCLNIDKCAIFMPKTYICDIIKNKFKILTKVNDLKIKFCLSKNSLSSY